MFFSCLNSEGYNLKKVLKIISGRKTLLLLRDYDFGKSMFNFVVLIILPGLKLIRKCLEEAGLAFQNRVLVQAVKSDEDWEALYEVTNEELEKQLELVETAKDYYCRATGRD